MALIDLVRQQRETYDQSLLNDIGHGNPRVAERVGRPMAEANTQVQAINEQIAELLADSD